MTNKKSDLNNQKTKSDITLRRLFTREGAHPFDSINWVCRDVVVGSGDKKVFEQKDVESPDFWSQNAINITAAKYFRGKLGSPEREESIKQIVTRITTTMRGWGEKYGYFANEAQATIFEEELAHILVHQNGSFNSPVWFNVGVKEKP
ncbi:MAG: vitamin B12-dependent ribonucleotide reductase, partial [Patescibacteria group bacterium]